MVRLKTFDERLQDIALEIQRLYIEESEAVKEFEMRRAGLREKRRRLIAQRDAAMRAGRGDSNGKTD